MIQNIYKVNIKGKSYGIVDSHNIAPVEEYNYSTDNYDVGDYLIWNQGFYAVIKAIEIYDTFKVNTNIKLTSVSKEIADAAPSKTAARFNYIELDIADIETGAIYPTKSRYAGDYIIWNDKLYKVTSDIYSNTRIEEGTNIEQTTITDIINAKINSTLDANAEDLPLTVDSKGRIIYKQVTGTYHSNIYLDKSNGTMKTYNVYANSVHIGDTSAVPKYYQPGANKVLATNANGAIEARGFAAPAANGASLMTNGQIYTALGNRSSLPSFAAPASGGTNLITNGQVYTALGNRTAISTAAPASGGTNLITNGQVYAALGNRTAIKTSPAAMGGNDLITNGMVYAAIANIDGVRVYNSITNSTNLNSNIQVSTSDLSAGSSSLATGKIYMVYE